MRGFGLVERGQVALEIGAAPERAVLALARRGVEVWGVDRAELAPQVLPQPGVHHLKMKVGALRWEDLPRAGGLAARRREPRPQVALHEVARRVPRLTKMLRAALKPNDWAFVVELPALVAHPAARAGERAALPSHRREVCAVARPVA